MTKETYQDLMKSNVNAWAIWGSHDPKKYTSEVWDHYSNDLKPGLILLGLNPSQKLTEYRNFHHPGKGNDTKLKNWIQGGAINLKINSNDKHKLKLPNLFGAFMTDLIHDQFEKKSSNVTITKKDVKHFIKILEKLGLQKYQIICFGNSVYNAATSWLLNEKTVDKEIVTANNNSKHFEIELYKVMHYSYYHGKNKTEEQLDYLNDIL